MRTMFRRRQYEHSSMRTRRFPCLDRFDVSRVACVLPGLRSLAGHIHGRITFPKDHVVHAVILCIVAGVVLANMMANNIGRESMLYRIFSERDIVEGPLSSDAVGLSASASGGGNFALAHYPLSGGITESDIEFEVANVLDGNALIATNFPATVETAEPSERRKEIIVHEVGDGETTSTIAARHGVSTNSILWSNGISASDVIKAGDILVIPPVTGLVHKVQSGDTISSIAKKYDADASAVVEQNSIGNGEVLKIGQELIVPDGRIPTPAPRPSVVASAPNTTRSAAPAPAANTSRPSSASGFIWPTPAVRGISQYFGWRHTGIDIPNRSLPAVHASKAGVVTFSGWLGGYGKLVIVDHGGGVTTYYAHLNQQYVAQGAHVSQGQAIGQLGSTGRSTGPHLHFEIRMNGRPVNPLNYL